MKSRKQFDCFLSDCCKDSENLTCINKSIENNRKYLWLKCKECGGVRLKKMEFKNNEEQRRESV